MWRLTIKQERKSEYVSGSITEMVEFKADNIADLSMMMGMASKFESGIKTTYKIEKVEGDV